MRFLRRAAQRRKYARLSPAGPPAPTMRGDARMTEEPDRMAEDLRDLHDSLRQMERRESAIREEQKRRWRCAAAHRRPF